MKVDAMKTTRTESLHPYVSCVPDALDDAGLDPYAFRALMRVTRHAAEAGVCRESVPAMAAACRMAPRRLRTALADLEARGLIARAERAGHPTTVRLLPPAGGAA